MMFRLFWKLASLASMLTARSHESAIRPAGPVPLDPVERLHRGGTTLPVMMELTRVGW
jgi:hypothetical protein